MPLSEFPSSAHMPTPSVWLLIDDRPGHRTQVVGLASWLGWPAMEKKLAFNWMNRLPNPVIGASLLSLDRQRSDPLDPPLPDLLIGMGRRVVPIALWLKSQNQGRTRVVLLGRKAASDPDVIDLSVACRHFQLLPHPKLVELVVPPTQVDNETLAAARQIFGDPLEQLPHPRVLLLVGGPTAQHRLEPDFAGRIACEVAAAAQSLGGSLAIVTSRRTPQAGAAAMREAAPKAHFHIWQADRQDNPYLAYLAAADLLVVTGESESMLAEAAATAKPLTIYPLQPRPEGPKQILSTALRRGATAGSGAWAWLCRALLSRGWMTPPRDLALMHRLMVEQGRAGMIEAGLNLNQPLMSREAVQLVERVSALVK